MPQALLRSIVLSFLALAATVQGQDLRDRALETLDRSLTAMVAFQRHGGWGTSWSLDGRVVWGEWKPIPDDWITVQDPATPHTAGTYLRAGQILNDPRWIAVAKEAHGSLCRLQSVEGGFYHEGPPDAGPMKRASFDDGVTTNTLDFFVDWWHHTGATEDRAAVERIGAFILTSQYTESGGWPQAYPLANNYSRYITFNDGNFSNIIRALFKLERETGDARYRAAALRGGACILKLQGPGEESIWAQQYDPDSMEPAWARKFEPPGYTPAESAAVCDSLVELFVETGDERYIDALGRALAWYEGHKLENGKYARLYEPGTQRPVYGRRDKAEKVYDFAKACSGYAWQGTWYPTRAKKAYEAIKSQGGANYRKIHASIKPSKAERPSDSAVEAVCARLSVTGHWTRNPNSKQLGYYEKYGVAPEVAMVLLIDFNAHVNLLLAYIENT